jgi:hypothetical protein
VVQSKPIKHRGRLPGSRKYGVGKFSLGYTTLPLKKEKWEKIQPT